MAIKNQIKFYKGQNAPALPVAGMIWFCTSDRTIRVYTGADWEKYAGLVDASWNDSNKLLTITSANGNTTTLNLSDMASASGVAAQIQTINTNVTNAHNAANAAQADVDALEKIVGEGFSENSTVSAQLAAVKATADAAAVKTTVDAELANKADVATTYSKTEVDSLVNAKADANSVYTKEETDAAIKVVSDALAKEVADRADAVNGLQDQIDDLEAASVTVKAADGDKYVAVAKAVDSNAYTVSSKGIDNAISAAVGAETANRESAISTLQGEVDGIEAKVNTLVGSDADKSVRAIAAEEIASQLIPENAGEALDTLQEIAAWIQAHPGDASAMNADIETLKSKVGEKAVSDQISDAIAALSDEAKSSDDANLVKVTVSQADGNVIGVSLDDSKLDTAISNLDSKIGTNTAAIESNDEDITALQGRAGAIESRLDGHDDDVERIDGVLATLATSDAMTALTNRVSANEAAIEGLDKEQDSQDQAIAAADAKGAQGIADAAAALAKANEKVASVSGDADVNASTINHAVSLSLNKATSVAKDDTKAVTSKAVYEHLYGDDEDPGVLCWAEWE